MKEGEGKIGGRAPSFLAKRNLGGVWKHRFLPIGSKWPRGGAFWKLRGSSFTKLRRTRPFCWETLLWKVRVLCFYRRKSVEFSSRLFRVETIHSIVKNELTLLKSVSWILDQCFGVFESSKRTGFLCCLNAETSGTSVCQARVTPPGNFDRRHRRIFCEFSFAAQLILPTCVRPLCWRCPLLAWPQFRRLCASGKSKCSFSLFQRQTVTMTR